MELTYWTIYWAIYKDVYRVTNISVNGYVNAVAYQCVYVIVEGAGDASTHEAVSDAIYEDYPTEWGCWNG